LNYRFNGGRLDGQNVGNLIIAAASEVFGSFDNGLERISDFLKVSGKVIPVSSEKMVLCAELENGNIVVGESQIPKVVIREGSSIASVFLENSVTKVSDGAAKAIARADIIIIGPGSLYTSIIPNFLTGGFTKAILSSEAPKVYIGNVMTQPGETDGMSLSKHIEVLRRYMEGVSPCHILLNNRALNAEELAKYTEDGAAQLLPSLEDREYFFKNHMELLEGDFIDIQKSYIRHNADAVAEAIVCHFLQT
jgi:uncharacterized cofD-like protein